MCLFFGFSDFRTDHLGLGQSAAFGLIVELPSSMCYQRRTVTRFVNQHRNGLVFGILVVVLLCGLVYLELQVPELTRAMGFGDDFVLDAVKQRRDRIRILGNGVAPPVMQAIVETLTRSRY